MKYLLFDVYETEIEFGELICESDDIEEIRQAAKLRREETDATKMISIDKLCGAKRRTVNASYAAGSTRCRQCERRKVRK